MIDDLLSLPDCCERQDARLDWLIHAVLVSAASWLAGGVTCRSVPLRLSDLSLLSINTPAYCGRDILTTL